MLGARALARRACDGKPVNPVLKAAITAKEADQVCRRRDAGDVQD